MSTVLVASVFAVGQLTSHGIIKRREKGNFLEGLGQFAERSTRWCLKWWETRPGLLRELSQSRPYSLPQNAERDLSYSNAHVSRALN